MDKREIVLDTETTGLNPQEGDRIIEIGCVELNNRIPTGRTFHTYINPQREVPEKSTEITGLTTVFLQDKPLFVKIVDDFLDFIQDSPLVIHNAPFDLGFLNMELGRLCRPAIMPDRVFDTLVYARKKFPGSAASLDALCRRFGVNLSVRTKHGALLDAHLLAEVYLQLMGGRQVAFSFQLDNALKGELETLPLIRERPFRSARPHSLLPEEQERHQAFLKGLKDPLWEKLQSL